MLKKISKSKLLLTDIKSLARKISSLTRSRNNVSILPLPDYKTREYIADKLLAANIKPFTIQASNAVIYDDNHIGEGAILCAFTTITSNVKIGRFFHANIYSYVANDSIIGNFVTFGQVFIATAELLWRIMRTSEPGS